MVPSVSRAALTKDVETPEAGPTATRLTRQCRTLAPVDLTACAWPQPPISRRPHWSGAPA
jgi:hypothetical protein